VLKITNENPHKVFLEDFSSSELSRVKTTLAFSDGKAEQEYRRFKNNRWFPERYGYEVYQEKLTELKKQVHKNLLEEEDGKFFTWSGLAGLLSKTTGHSIQSQVEYPEPKMLPWVKIPPALRDYQSSSVEELLKVKHGAVALPTGSGKSYVILNLVKQLGLKTIIVAPSTSICNQLLSDFKEFVGPKYVGLYAGAKKKSDKLFTIGTYQSFTRIEEGSEDWKNLKTVKVLVVDESHTTPSQTLAKVCFGLAKQAPYRFFFSATQLRNDGFDLLLDGIIGPIVKTMNVDDGAELGFLAKPLFKIFKVNSSSSLVSKDVNKMTREHLYYNPNVVRKVADLVNHATEAGIPTVVLIKEMKQFAKLLPYLRSECAFAHANLTEDQKEIVPEQYWESDPTELVKLFNEGKSKLLIGTSCISTGTDIRPVQMLIYWQGGKSEIQFKQAVGRGTRMVPGKKFCHIVDFDVVDVPTLHRHTMVRVKMAKSISDSVEFV
jgi:superfamily II DNA or RNA helicase